MEERELLARELHGEATSLLNQTYFWNVFNLHGTIVPCGSYALDLMVWPDLDVYFEVDDYAHVLTVYAEAARAIIPHGQLVSMQIQNPSHIVDPCLPRYYFRMIIQMPRWEWKIDLLSFEKKFLDARMQEVEEIKQKITPQKRALILQRKHELMERCGKGRTPSLSSYHLYKAVLDEGLEDFPSIEAYLISRGVKTL